MVWFSKSKHACRWPGKYENKCVGSLVNMPNVNEEYEEAFRTKSYIDMCNKVESHLGIRKSLDRKSLDVGPYSSLSPFLPPEYVHLSSVLLEPRQETLVDMTNGSNNFHHLLMDYFEVSFEASRVCEELLLIVHQNRANHRIIKRVFKLTKMVHDSSDNNAKSQCINGIFLAFTSYSRVKNPLSTFNPVEFRVKQDGRGLLFRKLTSKYRRTRRRMKFTQCFKKAIGGTLVVSCAALAICLLVLSFHSMVGMVAAPWLIGCSVGKIKKRVKLTTKKAGLRMTGKLDRLGTQLDVAARGVYTLINDLNTISRIGGRLHDEIEHGKTIAEICVRNGKSKVLKEVMNEFQSHERCFVELLKEFEEQVYLCLVNINRSRRLLVEETMVIPSECS